MLYNVALLAKYGSATAAAAVWASGTYSNGPKPYRLVMQGVSPLAPAQRHQLACHPGSQSACMSPSYVKIFIHDQIFHCACYRTATW